MYTYFTAISVSVYNGMSGTAKMFFSFSTISQNLSQYRYRLPTELFFCSFKLPQWWLRLLADVSSQFIKNLIVSHEGGRRVLVDVQTNVRKLSYKEGRLRTK
jgi:hypothetical protein